MRKVFLSVALACAAAANAAAQTLATAAQPAQASTDRDITPNRVLGEVTVISPEARGLALKTAAGASVLVMLGDKTAFKRALPGALTLEGATDIKLSDVAVGDRVLARGRVSADHKTVPAQLVVVMTKADIAKKQEHDRAEWQRRGVWGSITALNPATKEVTIQWRAPEGPKPVVVEGGGAKVAFRRYAPDSIKFDDAKPSSFAELKVGDQLRAIGSHSADGARFTPEEIVSGSFRTLIGTVASVDAAKGQIKITPSNQKQPVTVSVGTAANLRRLDPQAAQMLAFIAMRAAGGGVMGAGRFGGQGGQGGGQRPAGSPPQGEGRRPEGAPGGEGGGGGGGGGGRRMMMGGRGGFDLQEMVERQPTASLAELKPGDVIIVSSTAGADPTRLTAITVLAGAEQLLAAMQTRPQGGARQGEGVSSGLPAGIDFGIGLP